MQLNTRLQKLDPPFLKRLSAEDIRLIAEKHDYSIKTVRRMLAGQGKKYDYNPSSVQKVVSTAIEIMKSTEQGEQLENQLKKYIAA